MSALEITTFLETQNLTQEQWDKANIEWATLSKIAENFNSRLDEFERAALSISATLQKQSSVHSVRWRVKNKDHLLAKIIRKRAEGSAKYDNVDETNYDKIITDLVGVRVLHLFKEEWLPIQEFINDSWLIIQEPVVYYREGDNLVQYEGRCKPEKHKAGYRSIHSIITTRPQKKDINIELQIRTVFEEGWSEIDHQVRYPNFSDNEHIAYFLNIFNGLSGFADEMGTFVKSLAKVLLESEQLAKTHKDLRSNLKAAENEKKHQMAELESLAEKNTELQEAIRKFKDADSKVDNINRVESIPDLSYISPAVSSVMEAAMRANGIPSNINEAAMRLNAGIPSNINEAAMRLNTGIPSNINEAAMRLNTGIPSSVMEAAMRANGIPSNINEVVIKDTSKLPNPNESSDK